MKDEKFLCVLAGYDDRTEQRLAAMQNSLYEAGFSGTQTRDIPMHITMGTFAVEEEQSLSERLRRVAADTGPFFVHLSHVGMFGGSRVLFAAPDCSRELLALRERFSDSRPFPPVWVPHTTMLIDRPETVYRALPVLMEAFEPVIGKITCLHLYEFFPSRHILTVTLGEAQGAEQEEK